MASLNSPSLCSTETSRRGIPSGPATASTATGSGGATAAPIARAAPIAMPGTSHTTVAPTAAMVTATSSTARKSTERQRSRNTVHDARWAVANSSGGRNSGRISSGSNCGASTPGTNAAPAPTSTSSTGHGSRRRSPTPTSTTPTSNAATTSASTVMRPDPARAPSDRRGMLIPMAGFRDLVGRALQAGLDLLNKQTDGQDRQQAGGSRDGPRPTGSVACRRGVRTAPANERAGAISYQPDLDGAADPGEVVWTWVPYEEDASQGKDRPVLVVARAQGGGDLLGLMLSSQGHRRDDAHWLSVGSGPWDREGRESFVRLDRVLEIPEDGIRREGAIMPAGAFEHVADELRSGYGWR